MNAEARRVQKQVRADLCLRQVANLSERTRTLPLTGFLVANTLELPVPTSNRTGETGVSICFGSLPWPLFSIVYKGASSQLPKHSSPLYILHGSSATVAFS